MKMMNNALDVLIENECKLALEEMGYEFRDDIYIVYSPIGFPILYGTSGIEIRRFHYSMRPYMVDKPLNYMDLYHIVESANKGLMSDYEELIKEFSPKPITPSNLADIRIKFQMLFDKHFYGFKADFEVEVEDNRVVLNANNEETRNLWEKRL